MKLSDFIERCKRVSNFTDAVCIHTLISDLKIINESQKAKVPNFIGDWIFKAQLVDDLSPVCSARIHYNQTICQKQRGNTEMARNQRKPRDFCSCMA